MILNPFAVVATLTVSFAAGILLRSFRDTGSAVYLLTSLLLLGTVVAPIAVGVVNDEEGREKPQFVTACIEDGTVERQIYHDNPHPPGEYVQLCDRTRTYNLTWQTLD